MARRRSRLWGRKAKDLIWIAHTVVSTTLVANVASLAFLVQGSDWADASVGLERAKLLSIRGWLSCGQNFLASTGQGIFCAIGVFHEDASFPTLTSAPAYIEDVLWTGGKNIQPNAADNSHEWREYDTIINVKAKRKITNQQTVQLVVHPFNIGGNHSMVIRTLLDRNG